MHTPLAPSITFCSSHIATQALACVRYTHNRVKGIAVQRIYVSCLFYDAGYNALFHATDYAQEGLWPPDLHRQKLSNIRLASRNMNPSLLIAHSRLIEQKAEDGYKTIPGEWVFHPRSGTLINRQMASEELDASLRILNPFKLLISDQAETEHAMLNERLSQTNPAATSWF